MMNELFCFRSWKKTSLLMIEWNHNLGLIELDNCETETFIHCYFCSIQILEH